MAVFKNFFMTMEQMVQREKLMSEARDDYLNQQGVQNTNSLDQLTGDGDSCCPT